MNGQGRAGRTVPPSRCARETTEEFRRLSAVRVVDPALRPHMPCQSTPLDAETQVQETGAAISAPTGP
eukprot:5751397-Pyramimonas_sp.AAC.1